MANTRSRLQKMNEQKIEIEQQIKEYGEILKSVIISKFFTLFKIKNFF